MGDGGGLEQCQWRTLFVAVGQRVGGGNRQSRRNGQRAARSGRFDGIVALGAVVRGGTPHFDFVSGESIAGLNRVALECDIPVGNGILTVDTMQQAVDRAGGSEGNKGAEAALAAVEMVCLLRELGS